jgi:hypothetical protein
MIRAAIRLRRLRDAGACLAGGLPECGRTRDAAVRKIEAAKIGGDD